MKSPEKTQQINHFIDKTHPSGPEFLVDRDAVVAAVTDVVIDEQEDVERLDQIVVVVEGLDPSSATLTREIAHRIVRHYKQRRIKPLGGADLGNLIRARDRWPKR